MSDSGRVKVSKTGLIRGLLVALVFCLLWIGYGLSESAKYQGQADDNSREYARYTGDKVAEACVRISPVEKVECLNEAIDAQRQYEANQQDLVAQKQSALWAYIMGAAAVIGMTLSAVGVWLVKATFDETRRGNEIATIDAENNATHLFETRNATILVERAFVEIGKCVLSPPPLDTPDGFMVGFWLKNSGKSPARILRIDYHISESAYFSKKMKRFTRMNILVGIDKIIQLKKFKIRRQTSYPRYFTGVVTYATIYNAEFQTFFCYRLKGALMEDVVGDLVPEMLTFISHPSMPADT